MTNVPTDEIPPEIDDPALKVLTLKDLLDTMTPEDQFKVWNLGQTAEVITVPYAKNVHRLGLRLYEPTQTDSTQDVSPF